MLQNNPCMAASIYAFKQLLFGHFDSDFVMWCLDLFKFAKAILKNTKPNG
jgi:hypothetical protein